MYISPLTFHDGVEALGVFRHGSHHSLPRESTSSSSQCPSLEQSFDSVCCQGSQVFPAFLLLLRLLLLLLLREDLTM